MTNSEAKELVKALVERISSTDVDVVVCPNFTCLNDVAQLAAGSVLKVGAQNMFYEAKGAYTGETSPGMLKDLGVEYVILGHSERRQYFGETDEGVNKKALVALENGLIPIICVGETLEEREAGKANDIVRSQTLAAVRGIDKAQAKQIVVAYEPVWAIGTGKTATSQDANDVIVEVRKALSEAFGQEIADAIRIQYGGSMNAKNAAELMAMSDIDGGLIGGAALKAEDFTTIVYYNK
ncbi:triosephosphate isomerase [Bacteroidia bacterium]|nr:triosephosphate isomerase [Bacteroidia bacterium]